MTSRHQYLIAFLVMSLSSACASLPPSEARVTATYARTVTIAQRALPAVVTVVAVASTGDTLGQGSGFVASRNGVIVTAWHVLCGASRVWVALRGQEHPEPASFAGGDSLADVALLSIRHAPLRPLSMTSEIPPVGAPVIVVGTPLGLSGTVTEGILSAVRNPSGRAELQLTAAALPGSSGGPVIDEFGRVFAIVSSGYPFAPGLNFATPLTSVLALVEQLKSSANFAPVPWPLYSVTPMPHISAVPFASCRGQG